MSNKLCNKLSNKTPSYLTVRNGIYYFCYRLPVVISPDKTILIRHSLRTKSPVIAQQRVANLLPLVYSAKQEAENRYTSIVCDANKTVSNNVISGEVPMSKEESANDVELLENRPTPDKCKEFIHQYEINKLTALLKDISQMCATAFKDGAAKLEMTPDEFEGLSEGIYTTITKPRSRGLIKEDQRQATIKKYLSDGRVRQLLSSVSDEKADVLAVISKMVDVDIEVNAEKVKLITAYCSAQEQQYDSTTAKLESKLNRLLTEQIQVINNNDVTSQVPDLPAISHFIPDFLSWDERTRDADTINNYKRDLVFITHVIGDKPINQVTKQDIRETLKVKELMPKMNLKPYKDYGVDFVINAVMNDTIDIPDEHRLASKTVKSAMKSFQSFFSAYLFKELDLLEKSPTDNVKVKYQSYPFANYTDSQMDLIVNHYKQQEISDKQLVVLTACYTGMRLSEICNLTSDSIGFDDESGYHYIFIEKGKTEAARRLIPISKKLESTGLISFLKDLKGKELFSKKVDLITANLRKTRELLSIPHENEYEQRRVFHSFRHSVITKIRSHGITDALLQKVVGHETKKSITDRYTHEYAVKNLIHVVECLPW